MFVWRWNRVDEKLWKENRKENFFRVCLVGWRGRKINGGAQVFFSLGSPKCFLPKMERKLSEDEFFLDWQKCPCAHAFIYLFFSSPWAVSNVAFFFFGQHCLFFFFWAINCLFPFFFFYSFFFSFDFLGPEHDSSFFNWIFFFRDMIYIFLINLGDCSYLWLFVTFLF